MLRQMDPLLLLLHRNIIFLFKMKINILSFIILCELINYYMVFFRGNNCVNNNFISNIKFKKYIRRK